MALVAVVRIGAREELLGVGRYFVDEETRIAEMAFTVRDDWHDRGIGSLLMAKLLEVASRHDLSGVEAHTQADNHRMIAILIRNGFLAIGEDHEDNTTHWRRLLREQPPAPSGQQRAGADETLDDKAQRC
jgi:GNAT superfamily N-acetyltransferase